jgi:hypothetical protein
MSGQPVDEQWVDLSSLVWQGASWYRVLSYYFSVRWNAPDLGHRAAQFLSDFVVPRDAAEERSPPTPGLPAEYSIADLGPNADRQYGLFYGRDALILADDPDQVLKHLFWHVNAETVRHTGSFLLIHAGAAVTPSGAGILFPAVSGAGKTTLMAGLVRSGFGYLSDEAAAIDPVTGHLYPYPKALNLKSEFLLDRYPDLRSRANEPMGFDQFHVLPDELRPGAVADPCPCRYVVAYSYQGGASTELENVTKGETALVLARNVMNLPLYGSRAVPLIAGLAKGAECYRLVAGGLAEAVGTLTNLVKEA